MVDSIKGSSSIKKAEQSHLRIVVFVMILMSNDVDSGDQYSLRSFMTRTTVLNLIPPGLWTGKAVKNWAVSLK